MAFRAAVVLPLMPSMSSKCLPFNISFIFGNRKKLLVSKQKSLIDVSKSVPVRLCINRDAEQVWTSWKLILSSNWRKKERQKKKKIENRLYAVKCVHINCSYAVVCFALNIIFIRCFLCTKLCVRQVKEFFYYLHRLQIDLVTRT